MVRDDCLGTMHYVENSWSERKKKQQTTQTSQIAGVSSCSQNYERQRNSTSQCINCIPLYYHYPGLPHLYPVLDQKPIKSFRSDLRLLQTVVSITFCGLFYWSAITGEQEERSRSLKTQPEAFSPSHLPTAFWSIVVFYFKASTVSEQCK